MHSSGTLSILPCWQHPPIISRTFHLPTQKLCPHGIPAPALSTKDADVGTRVSLPHALDPSGSVFCPLILAYRKGLLGFYQLPIPQQRPPFSDLASLSPSLALCISGRLFSRYALTRFQSSRIWETHSGGGGVGDDHQSAGPTSIALWRGGNVYEPTRARWFLGGYAKSWETPVTCPEFCPADVECCAWHGEDAAPTKQSGAQISALSFRPHKCPLRAGLVVVLKRKHEFHCSHIQTCFFLHLSTRGQSGR